MAPGPDQRTDAELVSAINAGDQAAFDVLYYRYRDCAYRLAWRFTANTADAQDVVQEVFVYIARKFPGFELRSSFTTFLYPAVKHTALALRRKKRGQHALPGDDLLVQSSGAAGVAGDSDSARAELAAALAVLSEAHREILLMRFVDDLSLDEIAAALVIPLGTAKSRLHHAIAALRENPAVRRYFEP